MTKTSRTWRDKKLNKIRGYRKLHNSILGGITGAMAVIFLLTLCSDINRYTLTMFGVSVIWIGLVMKANN